MGKQFRIKVGACWLLLGLLFASIHLSQGVSLSRRLAQAATEEDNLICQVHINAILPPSGNISVDDEKNGQFTTCSLWVTGETTQGAYLVDTPGWILDYYQTPLRQGSPVFLIIPDGSVSQDRIIIPQPDTVSVLAEDHHERRRRRRRNLQQPTGKRTVMLRIRGLDAEPDFSIQELTSYLITHPLSARRQLERCSQNLLTLDASRYGVLDVPLNVEIQGLTNLQVMNLAETYVNEVILKSDSQVSNIRAWVDFLLFVIPPGTGGWAAFATVSGKQSVYNNRWGGYLGGLLHEIGYVSQSISLLGLAVASDYLDSSHRVSFVAVVAIDYYLLILMLLDRHNLGLDHVSWQRQNCTHPCTISTFPLTHSPLFQP